MTGGREFISLNGPDNVGKTTQLRMFAQRRPEFQMLGSVHQHDPEPWERVAGPTYDRWWFETSSTVELTAMLVSSHARRAAAREEHRVGLLDRGLPMLLATAAATSMVKDGADLTTALRTVSGVAASLATPPETAVLMLPCEDTERSFAISQAREGRQWTGIYPTYQRRLHRVLLHQADQGLYDAVVLCEDRSPDDIHHEVLDAVLSDHHLSASSPKGNQ
jgi:thymidylate kinase